MINETVMKYEKGWYETIARCRQSTMRSEKNIISLLLR